MQNINKGIKIVNVVSASQMHEQCKTYSPKNNVIVMAAAVADYTPKEVSDKKIKKSNSDLTIKLNTTVDILKTLGENKTKGQIIVGFALENYNEIEFASEKLKNKNLDLIVLNSLNDEGAGFKSDFNKITIIDKNMKQTKYDLKPKTQVAKDIINEIVKLIKK